MKTAEKRKRAAIEAAIAAGLPEKSGQLDGQAIEKRKEIEKKFGVTLCVESHAVSAFTPRTSILRLWV